MKKFMFTLSLICFLSTFSFSLKDICIDDKCLGAKLYEGIKNPLEGKGDKAKSITKIKIVENFCNTIKGFKELPSKFTNSYKTKDSLFLQLLCVSIGDDSFDVGLKLKEKKLDYYKKLKQMAKENKKPFKLFSLLYYCGIRDGILTDDESMNNVDFVCVAEDVYDTVVGDYTDMAMFIAYGGYGSEEKRKKWEHDFFVGKGTVCEDSYVESETKDLLYCQHPLTKKYLDEQAKGLSTMIKNLSIIEIEPDDIYDKFSVTKGDDKPGAVLMNLKDRSYNELYFYNLFLSYYAASLKIYNTTVALKKVTSDVQNIVDLNQEGEVLAAKQIINTSQNILLKTFDTIKNIYRTYPIHVGFLMLIEDFDKLREAYTYLYTPIDQLRYKLENAQNKKY